MSEGAFTPEPTRPPPGTEYDFSHLRQSRWAVRVVQVFCVLLCVAYGYAFGWSVAHVDENGYRFRDREGAWAHMAGNVLRCLLAGIVALTLRGYLRASRAVTEGDRHQLGPMLNSLANFWSVLAFGLLLLMMHAFWTIRGVGPLRPPATHEFTAVPAEAAEVAVEFYLAEAGPGEGLVEKSVLDRPPEKVYLHPKPFLTNDAVEVTRVLQESQEKRSIEIQFALWAQPHVHETTDVNRGRLLAIVVDGEVVFAATIHEPLLGSVQTSSGKMTADRAEQLARNLCGRR